MSPHQHIHNCCTDDVDSCAVGVLGCLCGCKVKLSLRHEDLWGVDILIHVCLTSATVVSQPPSAHWTGAWVGLRTGLGYRGEGKNILPLSWLELTPFGRADRNSRYPDSCLYGCKINYCFKSVFWNTMSCNPSKVNWRKRYYSVTSVDGERIAGCIT
jgi:hypothetical protein